MSWASLLSVKPVVLWSDWLIFLLVISLAVFFITLMRDPMSRARWRTVFESRVSMASLVVIVFYVGIALLDSLHYREPLPTTDEQETVHYHQEVRSLLDFVLYDLRTRDEKTYSEPFARYSFAKENMQYDDGTVYRDFPLLNYGGQHLRHDDERVWDITWRSVAALLHGLLVAGLLVMAHMGWRWWRAQNHPPQKELPWWAAYSTFLVMVMASVWMVQMGAYYHVAGTNMVGHDVLYQSIKAIRTGVLIGTLATLLTLPFAIVLGISAGYFKGWVDDAVQYLYTTLSSIPGILLIAASILLIDVYIETHPEQFTLGAVRADFKFLALCFILGLTSWTGLCRLLRAETLKISQLDYVQAAHTFGVSHFRVIFRHILPNVTHLVLIAMVLDFSVFVLAEAVLSYIGVGVDPSMASWGNMINDARSELSRDPVVWWPVISAFVLMFVLVLAANLFSDQVRRAFDPRGV